MYCALLATLMSKGYILLGIASSRVATSILPIGRGGGALHIQGSRSQLMLKKITCNMSKHSGLAGLLYAAKLIIWDEAPMMKRQGIETFDCML